MIDSLAATPPHHPTYNVHLSSEKITAIIALTLPTHDVVSIQQLESGKSFNNRIYFIETRLKPGENGTSSTEGLERFVLKISGYYFGARKVQNEIGSLLLLQKYCPNVPVPRVLAWSGNGSIIETAKGNKINTADNASISSKYGWILATRLPGRVLSMEDLEGPYGEKLIHEVARHLADWRQSIPIPHGIGNIRFKEPAESPDSSGVFDFTNQANDGRLPEFTVGGLILCQQYDTTPLPTPSSYYAYMVSDQLFYLRRSPWLNQLLAKIESQVQVLIGNMPRMTCFRDGQPPQDCIRFTHLDFAPRNILISSESSDAASGTDVPYVTGILDLEFAAFLPFEDEFINMEIRQSDDWSKSQYRALTKELVRLGCEVPHFQGTFDHAACTKQQTNSCTCESGAFEGLCILSKIIENIRPWFIQENSHSEEELRKEVDEAAEAVFSGIEKLNRFIA